MKKKIRFITTIFLSVTTLGLTSCLKDSRYVDFSKVGTIVDFPLGGRSFFGQDAITETPDTDANGTIVRQFAINVASPTAPSTATTVTLAIDNSIVTSYDASQSVVNYLTMPANAFSFTATTVSIPAGQRYATVSVTFYKNKLDPSKSYMLPIKIVSAGGVTISSNMSIHYYHFIGNPFAGAYTQNFYRYNGFNTPPPPGTPPSGGSFTGGAVTVFPVTPTQFEVTSGYYLGTERYEVTFNQVDATHFSNFQIIMNPDDVASVFVANGISMVQPPVFGFGITPAYDSGATYTYAQALSYFTYQYVVQNSSGYRFCVDNYVHN